MLGSAEHRLSRLEEKWPILQARAEIDPRGLRLLPVASFASVTVALILLWDYLFVRTALLGLAILTAPVLLHLLYWVVPHGRAPYRLSFEEYRRRLEVLRQSPRRPLAKRFLSATVSLVGIAATFLSAVLFVLGPHTASYLLKTVFLALGVTLLLMAASNLLIFPVYEKVNEIIIGMPLARRLRVIALAYAVAGSIYLGSSFVFRLGVAAPP